MTWSARDYSRFETERNRPIRALLSQIPGGAARIIDLGCGPGNSTELLAARFPDAVITGIDSSPDMIEAARKRRPDIRFEVGDIASRHDTDGRFDLMFANASLQWVPDHAALLPALVSQLAPGGTLAAQMPDNLDEPAHRMMREIALDAAWAEKLVDASKARDSLHSAEWYFEALRMLGARVDVWRTTYHHALPGGAADIVDWFRSTGLRPFLQPLDEMERTKFLARYEAAIARIVPSADDGTVLLQFPRLFFTAHLETG